VKKSKFDPMSGSWPIIALDVIWVTVLTLAGWAVTTHFAEGEGARLALYIPVTAVGLFVFTALPLRYFLLKQRDESHDREQLLSDESHRREFEARLGRALEMSNDQDGAIAVAIEAVSVLAPNACGELLLADSSRAHMQLMGATAPGPCDGACHCDVTTPQACPAVRSGHAVHFDDSRHLDACPNLRNRSNDPIAALCVPVSIAGSTVGVLHVVQPADQRFSSRDITGLTSVAKNTGSRVGMISAMAQSQLQANTDPLTGLLNRRSMENEVRTLLQHGESLAVIIADLDHFKVLNDTFGHDAGDRALRLFARVLRRSVRETDLVCRYGGEEFIIVCPSADKHTARFLFDRVRLELEAALSDGRNPSFTVSAGVADSGDASDFTDMISLADVALMQAKTEGRNRTIEVAAVG
jgi:diguanylate cyclase (GGDEF)-like protein